ncbi:hypothetical protein D9611_011243 [Ephemerocybe angulata]|uniref:Uncharacterized protein n=1 Tax=Ephemerocybe angulata TaxID=980116 RepID=A0A8H5CCY8_9AGAR|nr:hypothetical protein D9611_011243 [Tulosesus angulatus]
MPAAHAEFTYERRSNLIVLGPSKTISVFDPFHKRYKATIAFTLSVLDGGSASNCIIVLHLAAI